MDTSQLVNLIRPEYTHSDSRSKKMKFKITVSATNKRVIFHQFHSIEMREKWSLKEGNKELQGMKYFKWYMYIGLFWKLIDQDRIIRVLSDPDIFLGVQAYCPCPRHLYHFVPGALQICLVQNCFSLRCQILARAGHFSIMSKNWLFLEKIMFENILDIITWHWNSKL